MRAAQLAAVPPTPVRPDVAQIDHARILSSAERYLTEAPSTPAMLPCARHVDPAREYYSEVDPVTASAAAGPSDVKSAAFVPFTAHRDALFALGLQVPALAAAYALTGEERFAAHAAAHLRAWFIDPQTSMLPEMEFAAVVPGASHGSYAGMLEALPLVELVQAMPFLAASNSLGNAELEEVRTWFAAYLKWLTATEDSGPRLAALARDRKDHHGTSWLLQVSAYTQFTAAASSGPRSEDKALTELRHRFRTVTLRSQIRADGTFPQELTSDAPYRNSLFNLDMLAGICMLLSTRFESVWEYELEDGPGMRGAMAYHFPFIADRSKWPYRADAIHFEQLPGRRASLLFAARAYQRPEYAALWTRLVPDTASAEVLRTIPVHQPLLWIRQPTRHAAE